MVRNKFTKNIYRLLSLGMLFSFGSLSAEDAKKADNSSTPANATAEKTTVEQKTEAPKVTPEQEAMYWHALGHILVRNSNLSSLGVTTAEFEKIVKGIKEAVIEKRPLKALTEQQSTDMQTFFMNREKEQIENNKKLGAAFLQAKAKESGFVTAESGICYKITIPGDAVRANDDCSVEIDYEGKLIDGTVFDSSFDRKEHASFYLGMVIPGFREALKLIGNNGEIQVFIPSNLAYGDENMGPIPGGSVLEFRIKLYKITSPEVTEKK